MAVAGNMDIPKTYSEKDWSDLSKILAYPKSKTLAEKAAWDFVNQREKANQPCFELSVINPGLIFVYFNDIYVFFLIYFKCFFKRVLCFLIRLVRHSML